MIGRGERRHICFCSSFAPRHPRRAAPTGEAGDGVRVRARRAPVSRRSGGSSMNISAASGVSSTVPFTSQGRHFRCGCGTSFRESQSGRRRLRAARQDDRASGGGAGRRASQWRQSGRHSDSVPSGDWVGRVADWIWWRIVAEKEAVELEARTVALALPGF